MSLTGAIALRGSTVTVHHAVDTDQADGSSGRTYPTNTPGVKVLLEDISDELVRRVFGPETTATRRGLVALSATIRDDDGIVVTAGKHTGERYRVAKRLEHREGPSPHAELALEATTEAFP